MKKYDVVIVGCGPAGVAAANVLKQNNIDFCIIEKNKFPREKLCGGGLTHKSVSLLKNLNFDLDRISYKKTKNVKLVAKNFIAEMVLTNEVVMIDRLEFDYNNLKQVVNNNIFEKEDIISIDIEENIIITNKERYKFKYVIFADGVNGYSRRLIENRKFGFCVEYNSEISINKTILDFSAIESGYGWVFPKVDHTTIGLGKMNDKKVDYQGLLCDFANKYNFTIERSKIRGYHIPIFSRKIYKKSVIDEKLVLVGDAASLVDQVSGEGIYYALVSGKAAAESIIACLIGDQELRDVYFKKTKKIYRELCIRNFLSSLLYSRYGLSFIKLGLSNRYFIKYLNKLFG